MCASASVALALRLSHFPGCTSDSAFLSRCLSAALTLSLAFVLLWSEFSHRATRHPSAVAGAQWGLCLGVECTTGRQLGHPRIPPSVISSRSLNCSQAKRRRQCGRNCGLALRRDCGSIGGVRSCILPPRPPILVSSVRSMVELFQLCH